MAKQTKKAKTLGAAIDREKLYGVGEAIDLAKAHASAKFDETIEVAVNLGVDPRHADQMVRGVVTLPKGTGKTVRVGVFARGAKAEEALAAGADVVGAEDLLETVQGGTIEFDRCIATPDMMGLVGRLGKVLGPKGLMPNPKLGTVTMNVAAAVEAAKGGQVEYRVEKAGIIHSGIGKASFPAEDLRANFDALLDALVKAKPTGAKGKYVKKVAVSSTMGAGIKVDTAELGRLIDFAARREGPGAIPALFVCAIDLGAGAAMRSPTSRGLRPLRNRPRQRVPVSGLISRRDGDWMCRAPLRGLGASPGCRLSPSPGFRNRAGCVRVPAQMRRTAWIATRNPRPSPS